ncbi:MAG: ATP-binding protein [Selenomonadaceae bacterium]
MAKFNCTCGSLEDFRMARESIRENLHTICPEYSMQLFVAINEAVNNAFFHGINDHKGTQVTLDIQRNQQDLCMIVRHDGEGFTPEYIDCTTNSEVYNESGRGIDIIKHYVDSLEFSPSGCEVIMRKNLSSSSIRGGIS